MKTIKALMCLVVMTAFTLAGYASGEAKTKTGTGWSPPSQKAMEIVISADLTLNVCATCYVESPSLAVIDISTPVTALSTISKDASAIEPTINGSSEKDWGRYYTQDKRTCSVGKVINKPLQDIKTLPVKRS